MRLSVLVSQLRDDSRMTMEQLSKKSGLSKGYISRLENGEFDKLNVKLSTILKLSKASNLPVLTIINLIAS